MSGIESLLDRIKHLIDSGTLELPVFNETAAKLQSLNMDEGVDTDEVEKLILADQVLAAEVLRAANSAFFCGLTEIHTVRKAIIRLGVQQVSRLVLLASHRSKYDARDPELRRMAQTLWSHSSATAMAAGWVVRRLGFGNLLEAEAFLGGLLHDVGKLVIIRAIDEIKLKNAPYDLSAHLMEEILETAHPELGFSFLKHRDVPDVYCEIARDHHLKDFDPTKIALVSVRLANSVAAKVGLSFRPDPSVVPSALPEAQCLNASAILLAELEIMLEDSFVPAS